MPLMKSASPEAFKFNLKAELAAGRPKAQALAIAYSTQRRAGHAEGGPVYSDEFASRLARHNNPRRPPEMSPELHRKLLAASYGAFDDPLMNIPSALIGMVHPQSAKTWADTAHAEPSARLAGSAPTAALGLRGLASLYGRYPQAVGAAGGMLGAMGDVGPASAPPAMNYAAGGGTPPWFVRNEARDMSRYGMMHGATPGRADMIPTKVRGGAYVFPADVVSAFGQGNSMAGANSLNRMFKMGPYGTQAAPMPHAQRTPMPHLKGMADGGEVPIKVSDGEFLVPPEKVAELGGGDMNHAHDILDRIVELKRHENIKHLMSLPPPRDSKSEGRDDGGGTMHIGNDSDMFAASDEPEEEVDIPQPRDRGDPEVKALQGYGFNPQYGRRFLGMR